jgi:hypothetical protein
MKMKKSFTTLLALMFISISVSIGCECLKVSHRFMDNISKYPFVGMVEVIGKDTIQESFGNTTIPSSHYTFTKVRIVNQYSGRYVGSEIKIIDSKGFECFTKLFYKNVGDKFIIKAWIADVGEHLYRGIEELPKEEILVLSLCDMNSLHLEENIVSGWITVNRSNRWWTWTDFLKKISFGLIERERKKLKPQRMGIEKFRELIKERIGFSHH